MTAFVTYKRWRLQEGKPEAWEAEVSLGYISSSRM